MKYLYLPLLALAALVGCEKPTQKAVDIVDLEAISLLGDSLFTPEHNTDTTSRLFINMRNAERRLRQHPSEENFVWFGRRLAYLGRYREAIDTYEHGLQQYPGSYRLHRHKGHRYITLRQFDKAIADFQQAAGLMPRDTIETEPDGIPNKENRPLSSTQFNVWYHLGLAHYLKGDFEEASDAYEQCMKVSVNDDLLCATADWLYMTLRRLGSEQQAIDVLDTIHDDMNIIENDAYFKRLMMYKGALDPDSLLSVSPDDPDPDLAIATQGYGVGNWYLCNGDTTQAVEVFRKVVEGKHWAAFGYIAAEAELARLR